MNRAAFAEALQQALEDPAAAVSVMYVDLDNFKQINDSAGHQVGDEALRHVADCMAGVVRDGDVVGRLGGDEFVALVHGHASVASTVATRLLARLQEPFVHAGRELAVRASIGVADSDLADSRLAEDLLRDADLAMYLAKTTGKNRVVTYTSGVDRVVRERAELATDLRSALRAGELEVHYQPVVTGVGATLVGVEALLRWHHPSRGLVPPDEFIPLAEETGEIRAIGAWVLRTAAAQVVAWQRSTPGCEMLRLGVNLSAVQMRSEGLAETVTAALSASGLAPTSLTVEVTESMMLVDLDMARRHLDALRSIGVRVAIDDFGTGYSSLSYLSELPADVIKIDRSFVRNLEDNSGSSVLVQAVIDMAGALELDVIAEGVELADQQRVLNELGCKLSQGFLYSPALPAADFASFAADWPAQAEQISNDVSQGLRPVR